MLNIDNVCEIITCEGVYKDVWHFLDDGSARLLTSVDYLDYVRTITRILSDGGALWVRGLEKYSQEIWNHCRKINATNCHVILSPKGATVLNEHEDLIDVLIKCLYGSRKYQIAGKDLILKRGDEITIERLVPHKVSSISDAITINFGINKFFDTVDSYDLPRIYPFDYILLNPLILRNTSAKILSEENHLPKDFHKAEKHIEYIEYIRRAYEQGKTIVFLEMEKFSKNMTDRCIQMNSMSLSLEFNNKGIAEKFGDNCFLNTFPSYPELIKDHAFIKDFR